MNVQQGGVACSPTSAVTDQNHRIDSFPLHGEASWLFRRLREEWCAELQTPCHKRRRMEFDDMVTQWSCRLLYGCSFHAKKPSMPWLRPCPTRTNVFLQWWKGKRLTIRWHGDPVDSSVHLVFLAGKKQKKSNSDWKATSGRSDSAGSGMKKEVKFKLETDQRLVWFC